MAESLRRCPECVRLGYHFILHQVRALGICSLHHAPLRERCVRCAARLSYESGSSKVHGPIACPTCAAPLLPVMRGGYPTTGTISAGESGLIAPWLAFLQGRGAQPAWRNGSVMVDTRQPALDTSGRESLQAIMPAGAAHRPVTGLHVRWSDSAEHGELGQRYWQDANARLRQCDSRSHEWYRRLLSGAAADTAPSVRVLAFV